MNTLSRYVELLCEFVMAAMWIVLLVTLLSGCTTAPTPLDPDVINPSHKIVHQADAGR